MKINKSFIIVSILIFSIIISPLTSFAYIKLPNGNFEYTPEEVNNISKVLQFKDNEINSLKEEIKIENEKYEKMLSIKNNEIEKVKEIYKDNIDKNSNLTEKLNSNYKEQIDMYQKIIDNKEEKFQLMKNNSDEWKSVAKELNKENVKVKITSNFWRTVSSILALGLVGVAVSK